MGLCSLLSWETLGARRGGHKAEPWARNPCTQSRWPAWRGDRGLSAPCWRKRSLASSWEFSNLPSYLVGSTRPNPCYSRKASPCGCSSISRPSNASGSFQPLSSGRARAASSDTWRLPAKHEHLGTERVGRRGEYRLVKSSGVGRESLGRYSQSLRTRIGNVRWRTAP